MDRGTWWATIHGVAKSQTWLKQLSMHMLFLKTDTQVLKTQGFLSYRISHILNLSGGFIVILTCSFMSFISHELNSAIRLDYIPVKYFWPEPMLGNPGCSVASRACFLMRRKAIFGSSEVLAAGSLPCHTVSFLSHLYPCFLGLIDT